MESPPPWPTPPLMTGTWHQLDATLTVALRDRLVGTEVRCRPLVYSGKMLAYRVQPLPFWPGWMWADALQETEMGLASAAFLYGPFGALPIEGASALVHDINDTGILKLADEGAVIAYLRFFCSAVRGTDGPFHLIEDSARFAELTGGPVPEVVATHAAPIAITPIDSGWHADATVIYANDLFRTRFAIGFSGEIEMIDDEPLSTGLDPMNIVFDGMRSRPRVGAPA
ncbi:hypothetical protein ACFOMD_17170 [Sphingoaurantiacus capsulatus]|uniref:Uncharacterized protein n=1 Tax=Sphingoaurantiacus capsulatus TaxID=1771310 RepID=A0ABV7XEY3_9SPHN